MNPTLIPDYHFLILAPNLGAEWLFDAARRYWERFQPIIIPDFRFLALIPPESTITVTVIAYRDSIPIIGVELAQTAPTAYLDAVVYPSFDEARAELDRRGETAQPFGVPIVLPTPEGAPFIPTPRLPMTRPPAGFVTATPDVTLTPTPPPTEIPSATPYTGIITGTPVTPEASEAESGIQPGLQPIVRTPGPITGGGG